MTAQASSSVAPSAADHYPRYRWAMVTQLWLHQAFGFVIFSGLGILLPSLHQDLSCGPAQACLVSAARTVGQVMVFPASIFLVRYPPNRVYGTFLAIAALMAFATGLAPGLPILMGGLFVYSLAVAWSQVPGALVRLQWVPPRELATVQGISQGVGAVGQTFAFAAIPFLLGAVGGWRGVFFIVAGMLAVFSAVWRLS
ncbi:MAG: MFS transporter, partial [Chloroflexi bacterium]|nr:MFS transporter [Chloroflexota bacterium]